MTDTIWAAIIASGTTVLGLIAGYIGQAINARINHKRELEKLAFEKKYTVYNELIKMAIKYYNEMIYINSEEAREYDDTPFIYDHDPETGDTTYVHEVRCKTLEQFLDANYMIIPKEIHNKINDIINKLSDITLKEADVHSLIHALKTDIGIKI
ncbi:MAG: hypothetical protein AB7E76_13990 [Deferribacterales bacterium]